MAPRTAVPTPGPRATHPASSAATSLSRRRTARLTPPAERALSVAVEGYSLSGRGFDRAVKVARTVADIAGSDTVEDEHVMEALSFRGETAEEVAVAG